MSTTDQKYAIRHALKGRYARIVATIGPACDNEASLAELLENGVDIARLNFSHGSHIDHLESIEKLRSIAELQNRPITILQDLQGPKIRVGNLQSGSLNLETGETITLTTRPVQGTGRTIPVDYEGLPQAVQPGGRILIDDGEIELKVLSTHAETVEANVVVGGLLKPHKSVNLPNAHLDMIGLTEKDIKDLAFGLKHGVDAVAISFVRSPEDILQVRQYIAELAPDRINVPVIAKLERPEALDHLDEILHVSDGVMVARGDLGVEMSPEAVPIAQKSIIAAANRHAKVVITATQMLDSMINNPRPTRAEASDVANAIFDGTDAVMLSGETASGNYPFQSVKVMDAIVREAEAHLEEWGNWTEVSEIEAAEDETFYICRAARELARDRNVDAIAVFTVSGRSALILSKYRPQVPILAFTPSQTTYHKMNMYWGVIPHLVESVSSIDAMLVEVDRAMLEQQRVIPGQQVVLICGYPVEETRPTNLALLHTVGG